MYLTVAIALVSIVDALPTQRLGMADHPAVRQAESAKAIRLRYAGFRTIANISTNINANIVSVVSGAKISTNIPVQPSTRA